MLFDSFFIKQVKKDDKEDGKASRDVYISQGMQGFYPLYQNVFHVKVLALHLFLDDFKKLVKVKLNVFVKGILDKILKIHN